MLTRTPSYAMQRILDTGRTARLPALWQRLKRNPLFVVFVLLPTLFSALYFGVIASDVYVSESQLIVRSQATPVVTGIGSFLQKTGLSDVPKDTYVVRDFILSRDALRAVDENNAYRTAMSNHAIDILSRFNGIGLSDGFEELFRYYKNHVTSKVDSESAVMTITVHAFNATEAKRINDRLISESESLVNQLNQRARHDMIAFAESEVERALQRSHAAAAAMATYRNSSAVFDPDKQSALQLQLVSKLQDQIIATHAQLDQMIRLTPKNPQIPALRERIRSLETQAQRETAKVAGGRTSLSDKSSAFTAVKLEQEFSEKQLATAMAMLEQARSDAMRQQLYLETIEKPDLPDRAMEPRRLRDIFTTLIMGLVLWGVAGMLIAGIKEHHG